MERQAVVDVVGDIADNVADVVEGSFEAVHVGTVMALGEVCCVVIEAVKGVGDIAVMIVEKEGQALHSEMLVVGHQEQWGSRGSPRDRHWMNSLGNDLDLDLDLDQRKLDSYHNWLDAVDHFETNGGLVAAGAATK